MKRLFLLTGVASLAALSLSTQASAEPGIIVLPSEDVELVPTANCPVMQGGQTNAGLGCGGVSEPGTVTAYDGDLDALTTGLATAVEAYEVYVTNTRPPEYVPYMMLMASTEDLPESTSFTCTSVGANCGVLQRNNMGFTSGSTEQCTMPKAPETLASVVYAFGRMSGLEGTDSPTDAMFYTPDYTMPNVAFEDQCNNLVQQNGFNDMDEVVQLPLECTSRQHTGCDEDNQQNANADLLEFYGARTEDTDAPTFEDLVPEDGAEIEPGEFLLGVTMVDAETILAARWTVSSPALEELGVKGGIISKCTNDACLDPQSGGALNWQDGTFKATDSDWGVTEFADFPPGDYEITLEASDYHGNVADPVTINVTVTAPAGDSGGADETGGGDGDGDGDGGDNSFDGGDDDGGTGGTGDGGSGAADDGADDEGCSCTTAPTSGGGMLFLMAGLLGLGLRRRD